MALQSQQQSVQPTPHDELILVVRREHLFSENAWHGIKEVDFSDFLRVINAKKEFLWRSNMEEDPTYKQIIPYLIYQYQNHYFMMQRRHDASAKALQNKFSLGIGGHIRQEDMTTDSIFDWATREFHEEVAYQGSLHIKPLGIINDDTNLIGQVHLGFAMLLIGDSPHIAIRSEHKSGKLMTLDECAQLYDSMETWSQMIFTLLKS